MTNEKLDKDSEALDVLTREAGLGEMKNGATTPTDRRFAKDLVASYQSKIAEARRALVPEPAPIEKAPPILPALAAMGRDALLAMWRTIAGKPGSTLQLAYRDLNRLSDDDLRRLIQMCKPDAE